MEISKYRDLDTKTYQGVDVSDVVIERNRTIRPNWIFGRDNIWYMSFSSKAGMVLCLDILIHQKSCVDYETVIKTALHHAGKIALISGYIRSRNGWDVFSREALDKTIKRWMPSAQITRLATYRGTELFAVSLA